MPEANNTEILGVPRRPSTRNAAESARRKVAIGTGETTRVEAICPASRASRMAVAAAAGAPDAASAAPAAATMASIDTIAWKRSCPAGSSPKTIEPNAAATTSPDGIAVGRRSPLSRIMNPSPASSERAAVTTSAPVGADRPFGDRRPLGPAEEQSQHYRGGEHHERDDGRARAPRGFRSFVSESVNSWDLRSGREIEQEWPDDTGQARPGLLNRLDSSIRACDRAPSFRTERQ
mgnify:CR=1 FL=1